MSTTHGASPIAAFGAAGGASIPAQAPLDEACTAGDACGCAAHSGSASGSASGAGADLEHIHLMMVAIQSRLAQAVGEAATRSSVELRECLADLGLLHAAVADVASQHRQTVSDLERAVANVQPDSGRSQLGDG